MVLEQMKQLNWRFAGTSGGRLVFEDLFVQGIKISFKDWESVKAFIARKMAE